MKVRSLLAADVPILNEMATRSGFDYPSDLAAMEAVLVVETDDGRILMACAAERICQLFLWMGEGAPGAKLHGLRLLHTAMAEELKAKGYTEANAFLPPCVALQFGRRLERSFAWAKNWPSWFRRF